MATKKTTGRTRSRSKAAQRKTASGAAAGESDTETPAVGTGEAAQAATPKRSARGKKAAGAESTAAKTTKRTRRKSAGATETKAAAAAAPAKEADKAEVAVDSEGDSIVIRFPSIAGPWDADVAPQRPAPPPRAAAPPPAPAAREPAREREAPPSAEPPLARPQPAEPRAERPREPGRDMPRERDAPRRRREETPRENGATAAPRTAPLEDEPGAATEEGGERRRRRRRRRRRGRGGGGEASAAAPPDLRTEPTDALDADEEDEAAPAASASLLDDLDERVEMFDEIAEEVEEAVEVAEPEEEEEAEAGEAPQRGRRRGRTREDKRGRRRQGRFFRRESDDEPGEAPELIADLTETDEATEAAGVGRPAAGRNLQMVINVVPREECRIALLQESKLEEIYLERASSENHVWNIYKGVVTNVEPSIQAAFIDFGLGKNGFLHISDLHPQYFPDGEGNTENVGRKLPRRHRPPIQKCLRRGQELLVQITKEGIGTKGPTLTTYLSIPGRFLVMMPGMRQLGVSRKIENDDVRRSIRAALDQLDLPDDIGFIARTAAEGRSTRELQNDLNYLTRLWKAVEKRIKRDRAPAELYRDSDLVIRTIRDVYSGDVQKIIVDDADVANRAREFLSIFNPDAEDIVVDYQGSEPIFHHYGVEAELERLHSRHVPLRSGGSLVIDQAEALVAIDVNSGRFRSEDDAETTAFKLNLEAADEIPRQLRLRDLGGVIICDFIDMRQSGHKREIERRLINNLKKHKERAKVLRMSDFGIIEMTRQRQRASLTRSVYQDCHHCRGTGLVKTAESVALDVMRLIQLGVTREHIRSIEVQVSNEVAHLLLNRKRAVLHEIETTTRRRVAIRPGAGFGLDQVVIQCTDQRGRIVPHP